LNVYYRYENKTTAGDIDTAMTTFSFTSPDYRNANANYVVRDYGGTQVLSGTGDNQPDQVLYIQNTPGTFATIKIPGLNNFPKGVVHLAELQMESIYDNSDTLFAPPLNMLVDVYDSTASKFKLMPYSFTPQPITNSVGVTTGYSIGNTAPYYSMHYLSSSPSRQYYYKSVNGQVVKNWRFNLTPYFQKLSTGAIPAYNFRLYAPAAVSLPLGDLGAPNQNIQVSNPMGVFPAMGRVRIGGGNHQTQKMKLRIVYSKP